MDGRPHRWYKAGTAGRWANCQVWNWRVFFKVWNYFYSLTHSKERYKVYKRGRDPWSRHVPNSWEAAVSAAPFLDRVLLLRPKKNTLKFFSSLLNSVHQLVKFHLCSAVRKHRSTNNQWSLRLEKINWLNFLAWKFDQNPFTKYEVAWKLLILLLICSKFLSKSSKKCLA